MVVPSSAPPTYDRCVEELVELHGDLATDHDPPIRVGLFERHAVVREGLVALIERSPRVTIAVEADALEQAGPVAIASRAHVVVLGIGRPHEIDYSVVRSLCDSPSAPPVILLGDYSSGDEVMPGLQAGARGFVAKKCIAAVLVDAIRTVHDGLYFMGPLVLDCFLSFLVRSTMTASAVRFTTREHEVLRLIGEGNTDREIGTRLGLSAKTIHTHRTSIMRKLGVHNLGMLVRRAMELGLIAS
ncbi:response regulator transcription factor [Candidatus Binatia bacterium]|nr:response regulator transcription factor [Candidatus Binatia bacterium]